MKITTHQDFLDWYQPIHAPFVRFCSSKAIGWMETEDLVQEAILGTLQGFNRIEDKNKLLGFMSDRDNWMRAEAAKEYGLIDEVIKRSIA